MKNWQRAARMSLPVLLALALVACGDSDDTKTGTGAGSTAAAAAPDPVTVPPTEINVSTPLDAPPAAGKTLFWLQCELPICEKIGGGVKAAAEAAGWDLQEPGVQVRGPRLRYRGGCPAGAPTSSRSPASRPRRSSRS